MNEHTAVIVQTFNHLRTLDPDLAAIRRDGTTVRNQASGIAAVLGKGGQPAQGSQRAEFTVKCGYPNDQFLMKVPR